MLTGSLHSSHGGWRRGGGRGEGAGRRSRTVLHRQRLYKSSPIPPGECFSILNRSTYFSHVKRQRRCKHLVTCVGMDWQEIPTEFTGLCGFPSTRDCKLVTSMRREDQWAVQFRTHGVTDPRVSAFSVGDGFPKFVKDNNIANGTLLVLEHVDTTCLVVTILRRQEEEERPATPPPSPHTEVRPHFRKTLKASHTRPFKSTRLVSPSHCSRNLSLRVW